MSDEEAKNNGVISIEAVGAHLRPIELAYSKSCKGARVFAMQEIARINYYIDKAADDGRFETNARISDRCGKLIIAGLLEQGYSVDASEDVEDGLPWYTIGWSSA